ncbi:MAG: hypothetical protein V4675_17350 [Verrucomicrobiota bacterium]
MPPPNNRCSKALVFSSLIGLGAGAALGYQLKPKPSPAVPPALTSPPRGSDASDKTAAQARPYDMPLVVEGGFPALAEFEAWLASASCDEVSRLLLDPAWNGHPHPPLSALLVQRFGEFSVEDRFGCLQKLLAGKEKIGNYALLDVLSDLARDTLPRRAAEMKDLFKLGEQLNPHSLGTALADWAAEDFAAAAAFAAQIEGHGNERIMASLIGGLADRDLPLAQREALKTGKGQEEAVRSVANRMGKKDLAAALDWLNANGQTGRGKYGIGGPYQSAVWAACGVDSAAVAQLIVDRPGLFEGDGGAGLVGEVFKQWASTDSTAATAWLASHSLPEVHREAALKQLEQVRQANLPLDAALAEVRNLPPEARAERAALLADRLVADDPAQAAARFASLLPEGAMTAKAAEAFMERLPTEFFAQAVRQFSGVLEGMNQYGSLKDRLSFLPEKDLEELMPQLPGKTRAMVRQEVLQNALSTDPDRAVQMAEGMTKESLDPFAGSSIAVHLAGSDPQKAAGWVEAFPEGPSREWAAQNLVANWTKYDPDAAVAWLETLPPGRSRDRAALEAAKIQGVTGNHESALALAAGLGNAKEREEATGFALQRLWNRDPAGGASALSGSGLAAEQQAAVEKKLKQGGFGY